MATIKWELDVDGKRVGGSLEIPAIAGIHPEHRAWKNTMDVLRYVLGENLEAMTGVLSPGSQIVKAAMDTYNSTEGTEIEKLDAAVDASNAVRGKVIGGA